ncbi:MAG: peroxiredoxin [Rhodobiaceae bacterium]|nr:peroxiredoxin [Rhodobiaceae bacterium]MBT6223361.1 peroxiredoxin [Rhodobiaceae bacterium]MDB4831194.1 peroxiredoxin [Hyphomicrobiales bacterium]MDC3272521.1 peroxiredoxin [Hyphomicrobiales bacterium]
MIQEGMQAIDFNMFINDNEKINLDTYKGKHIVLYFYPKDDTPGCTKEAIDFTQHKKDFESSNTVVIGVSADSIKNHEKFKKKHNLDIVLGSDENKSVVESYEVWVEKSMYGKKYMGIDRTTVLINKDRIISKVWKKVSVPGHVDEVLKEVINLES